MGDAAPPDVGAYDEDKEKLQAFLESFQEDDLHGVPSYKYMDKLQKIANRREKTLEIELDDVHEQAGDELAEKIRTNAPRYREVLASAADAVMPGPTVDVGPKEVADVLQQQREESARRAADRDPNGPAAGAMPNDPQSAVPASLKRRYDVLLLPRAKEKAAKLREVKSSAIGALVTVKGIVTRVT